MAPALCARGVMLWLSGKLPPAGCAGSLLSGRRHRLHVYCCAHRSDSQQGRGQGGEEPAAPVPTSLARPWGSRRSLSPLHRVSHMISPEFISQEINDLLTPDPGLPDPQKEHPRPSHPPPPDDGALSPTQGTPFMPGDLVVAEFKRKHYSMFKKMFVLKSSGKLLSNWGAISSLDIVGKLPGQKLQTSTGFHFLLKRPSLDEYVTFMKRGPTISYPKVCSSILA